MGLFSQILLVLLMSLLSLQPAWSCYVGCFHLQEGMGTTMHQCTLVVSSQSNCHKVLSADAARGCVGFVFLP